MKCDNAGHLTGRFQTITTKMAGDHSKLDIAQATAALKSLRSLRNNVGTLFNSLIEGIGLQSGQDSKESKFVAELQQQLVTVQTGVKYVSQDRRHNCIILICDIT